MWSIKEREGAKAPTYVMYWVFCCCCLVTQLCLTLCNSMDYSLPGFSILGILQARILKWIIISFSRGSSPPKDWTCISCITGGLFTIEPQVRMCQIYPEHVTCSALYHLIFTRTLWGKINFYPHSRNKNHETQWQSSDSKAWRWIQSQDPLKSPSLS